MPLHSSLPSSHLGPSLRLCHQQCLKEAEEKKAKPGSSTTLQHKQLKEAEQQHPSEVRGCSRSPRLQDQTRQPRAFSDVCSLVPASQDRATYGPPSFKCLLPCHWDCSVDSARLGALQAEDGLVGRSRILHHFKPHFLAKAGPELHSFPSAFSRPEPAVKCQFKHLSLPCLSHPSKASRSLVMLATLPPLLSSPLCYLFFLKRKLG